MKPVHCSEKKSYRSQMAANFEIGVQIAKGFATYLRAYPCIKCGHWHLTHTRYNDSLSQINRDGYRLAENIS